MTTWVCEGDGHEVSMTSWSKAAEPTLCPVGWCGKPLKRKVVPRPRLEKVDIREVCPACVNRHHSRCAGKVLRRGQQKPMLCGCAAYDHRCKATDIDQEDSNANKGKRRTRR